MSRFYWLYGIMVVLAAWLARETRCPSLFQVPPTQEQLWWPLVGALAFSALIVQGGKALEGVPWYRNMAKLFRRMLTSPDLLGPEGLRQKAFVIGVYSSIGEEAFFRGFLQPYAIAKIGGWIGEPGGLLATGLGILAASLVFGLLHFPVIKELRPWTLFAILAGIAFGVLAAWSQCLLAPVLAHLLINWLNLKRLAEIDLGEDLPSSPAQTPGP